MKKYLKKLLCSIFAVSILLVSTIHVNAATPYRVISDDKPKTKVGNYYIWVNNEKGIYVSKSKKSLPKKIVKISKSSDTYITYRLVTNGSRIYYATGSKYDEKDVYLRIYRIDVSGKNKVYIGKIYYGGGLSGYYNGNLFIERCTLYKGDFDPLELNTYIYNLKSKKLSLVKKDFKIDSQKGKYILGSPRVGAYTPVPVHIYNASTKKIYKISSTASSYQTKFLNGKIYYEDIKKLFELEPSKRKISIKTCSYTGSNQKTLYTIKMEKDGEIVGDVIDIKSSYVEYTKFKDDYSKEIYYRYYYSSKKVVKVKEVKL